MEYVMTKLDTAVSVDGIYTVHYFEYAKDFAYSGEVHNFWELVYADKKSLYVTAGASEIHLAVGQMYLHRPNEFHNIRCDGSHAANSVIVSFSSDCEALLSIAGMVIDCTSEEKRLLGGMIKEAESVFSTPLGVPYIRIMQKSGKGAFGGEQLIRLYLEQLLILLVRGNGRENSPKVGSDDKVLAKICDYLEQNIHRPLCFSDIVKHFNLSASVVKRIFREQMGCGVMECFNRIRVDAAKELIRESDQNFTEIAASLCFGSSQYFTTVFKRVSGMTPTEYRASALHR